MTPSRHPAPAPALSWGLLALLAPLLAAVSYRRWFDHDEFEAVHTAWKIWRGETIYVDFIQHHHPLLYFLLQPVLWLFGPGVDALLAARFLMLALLAATVLVTYGLGLELYRDRRVAAAGALLLALTSLFVAKMVEIRPDVPQTLLALAGTLLVLRGLRTERRRELALGGLLFGLAFLFLQKAVVLLVPVGALLLWRLFRREARWGGLVAFGLGAAAPVLAAALVLAALGLLDTFVFFNVTYNGLYYRLRGWEAAKLVRNLGVFVGADTLLVLLTAAALVALPKRRADWVAAYLAGAVLLFTLVSGRHNPQYYLPALPFVALLAARGLTLLPTRVAALALLVAFAAEARLQLQDLRYETNERQLARVRYVMALTEPDDVVYDGNILFNLFRPDLDFLWYMVGPPYKAVETMAALRGYEYDVLELIAEQEPKVISDFGIDAMDDPRIAAHYRPSERFAGLWLRIDAFGPGPGARPAGEARARPPAAR